MTAQASRQPRPVPAAPGAWLPAPRRAGQGRPLVCLPPAGAGAGFFRAWSAALPGHRVVPVQLPGREERYAEAPMTDARAIAAQVAAAIEGEGWPSVALLGYSFGALLAFETAVVLEAGGRCRVEVLVACARAAPQPAARPSAADWGDEPLLDYIRSLGGLPPEVLAEPAFLAMLLPVLRADLWANDRHAADPARRIAAPIVTVAGSDDAASGDARESAWAARTRGGHRLALVPGGHFFISDNPDAAFAAVSAALQGGGAPGTAG